MTKRLRGFISFLLVLVLCFGMIPNVSAAEIGATESIMETEATEATTAETTAPPDETSPTETSGESTPPTEESTILSSEATSPTEATEAEEEVFSDIVISSGVSAASTDDYGIMTAASTQSGILLFDFSDNGNYTTVLNSQLAVSYPSPKSPSFINLRLNPPSHKNRPKLGRHTIKPTSQPPKNMDSLHAATQRNRAETLHRVLQVGR